LITASLVLTYLIFDELLIIVFLGALSYLTYERRRPPARYALSRVPETLKQHPLRQLLLALVTSVWERRHSSVYAYSADLVKMFEEQDFSQNQISLVLNNLLTAFLGNSILCQLKTDDETMFALEGFRTRTFKTLTKAYTSLPIQLAEIYLGLPQEQIIAGKVELRLLIRYCFHRYHRCSSIQLEL
jgi:hypothetical protein